MYDFILIHITVCMEMMTGVFQTYQDDAYSMSYTLNFDSYELFSGGLLDV